MKGGIITDYKTIYRKVFNYHERWNPYPKTPEEWDAAINEINIIAHQGGNESFITDLLRSVFSEIERQYRNDLEKGEVKCG